MAGLGTHHRDFHGGGKAAQLIEAVQTGNPHVNPPQSLSHCKGCQHGRPREYIQGRSETVLNGQPLPPRTAKGNDRKHYHSPCGDRFGWIPPHELAEPKGLR